MNFIFFGRLEQSKGFDYLIQLIQASITQKSNHNFYILGTGNLEQKIYSEISKKNLIDLSKASPNKILNHKPTTNQVIYCGKRDYSNCIKPLLKNKIDYSLIPSTVLETFGLTALESLSEGVPVITSDQANLKLLNELNLFFSFNLKEDLQLLSKLKPTKVTTDLTRYSSNQWIKNLQKKLPTDTKKILLVSDFYSNIGGTERHIQSIKKILSKSYQVQTFRPAKTPNLFSSFLAIKNPIASYKLKQKINKFKPDLIWAHSLQRHLGTSTARTINNTKIFSAITIHDFGLFTDYPSKLKDINKIYNKPNSFLAKLKHLLIQKPLLTELRKFDRIFVPSEFMQKPISKKLNYKVTLLPHFIDQDND